MQNKALSLLEIVVATVILAVVMMGLVNIFISGKRYILHARWRMTGGEIGKFFLDPLQMQVRQDIWSDTCLGGNQSACPNFISIENTNYTCNYNISNLSGTTLRRVILNITWNETPPS